MEIDCFLYPGWSPRIRAAGMRRDWMDATPESFAYRCLPLGIANGHGWEIGNPIGFSALWTGGSNIDAVNILLDDDNASPIDAPISLFGQGTITFHIAGLLRTPPGWNLWISGPPNAGKDGIAPLSGVIETDWSPYTFTMNWRFTRANQWVRFEADEPICFFFPVERGALERAAPRARAIEEAPDLKQQFEDWSRSRESFQARMSQEPPTRPSDKWQKLYYRGLCPAGDAGAADHQSKLRVREFADLPVAPPPPPAKPRLPDKDCTAADGLAEPNARRDWLLGVQDALRALAPQTAPLPRFERIDPDYFLKQHYAANRPVLLGGEMADWPAARRWTPDYLSALIGDAPIEFQGGRQRDAQFDQHKLAHRLTLPFSQFINQISKPGAANDAYITAFNASSNKAALGPLHAELGRIDRLLTHGPKQDEAMLWIGPMGTFTPLHHDLTNNLLAQVVGRKRVILVPPSETHRLHNHDYVFSGLGDLLDPVKMRDDETLGDLQCFDVLLEPGDALFIPVGWWHQVRALDFCVSATYTNFRWPNAWAEGFPGFKDNA